MSTMEKVSGQIVDLELRFMKLERFVQELSDTVASHQRTIDALTGEVRRLRQRSDDAEEGPANEVPPHY
jgi:uncharacterized coiled-coil protein SlyX